LEFKSVAAKSDMPGAAAARMSRAAQAWDASLCDRHDAAATAASGHETAITVQTADAVEPQRYEPDQTLAGVGFRLV
jgi:hypothetical protein